MSTLKAIIGLGNPGGQYTYHRHNIGFRVVEKLVEIYHGAFKTKDMMEIAEIIINDNPVLVIKPKTYMNSSGQIIPGLLKRGIKAENILVVHDELEKPFGSITSKIGGSHKGHNGLKSIISVCGADFVRLRFGIGRPEDKAKVPDYVLTNFKEPSAEVNRLIDEAVIAIEELLK